MNPWYAAFIPGIQPTMVKPFSKITNATYNTRLFFFFFFINNQFFLLLHNLLFICIYSHMYFFFFFINNQFFLLLHNLLFICRYPHMYLFLMMHTLNSYNNKLNIFIYHVK